MRTVEELADVLLSAGHTRPRKYVDLDEDWQQQVRSEVSAVRQAVLDDLIEEAREYANNPDYPNEWGSIMHWIMFKKKEETP